VAEPPLGAIEKLAELSGKSIDWFLTGEEPEGVRGRGEPPHGYDLIRLPRGDPRRLSPLEADLLERALVVLRAEGESEHFAQSLMANISSFYRGVLQANGPHSRQDEGGREEGRLMRPALRGGRVVELAAWRAKRALTRPNKHH
jgi:hypothetical protein